MKVISILFVSLLIVTGSATAQDPAPQQNWLTYQSDAGIVFQFPEPWLIDEDLVGINLVSNPLIFRRMDAGYNQLFGEEIAMSMTFMPTAYAESNYGIPGADARARLETLVSRMSPDIEVGEIETLDNGMQRVVVRQAAIFEGVFVVWDVTEDLTGIATVQTGIGNLQNAESTAVTILESVEFTTTVEALLADLQGGE